MTLEKQLDQLRAIVGEHFDEYLIVVSKGPNTWTTYRNKLSAMGMCKMVENDIKLSWNEKDCQEA